MDSTLTHLSPLRGSRPLLSRSVNDDDVPQVGSDDEVRLPVFERALARRSVLLGSAALGVVLAAPALACGGSGDKAKFDSSVPTSTTAAAPSTTAAIVNDGPTLPANAAVTIAFTYSFTGGMAKNPYIAVWIQNAAGKFVDTVSLWYERGKGDRYLTDMRSWISASGGRDTTMSSATRTAGSYSVVWDGKNAAGNKVAQGDYVVYIECAREKGPYSVISVPISCGTAATTATAPDKGEISKVSVAYKP